MSHEHIEVSKKQLAVALAQGKSVQAWAKERKVPSSTARRWAKEREVREEAEACRRRALDRAVDQLARLAPWAVAGIAELAESAESESVRLRALRAILGDMMAVSKYTGLEDRVAGLEDVVHEQNEG
jgi:hypothetical protein